MQRVNKSLAHLAVVMLEVNISAQAKMSALCNLVHSIKTL